MPSCVWKVIHVKCILDLKCLQFMMDLWNITWSVEKHLLSALGSWCIAVNRFFLARYPCLIDSLTCNLSQVRTWVLPSISPLQTSQTFLLVQLLQIISTFRLEDVFWISEEKRSVESECYSYPFSSLEFVVLPAIAYYVLDKKNRDDKIIPPPLWGIHIRL